MAPEKIAPSQIDPLDLLAAHKVQDQFGVNGIRTEPGQGRILFANPPGKFELPLDSTVKSVTFNYGIVPTAIVNKPPTHGVEFRVVLRHAGQETILLDKKLDPLSNAPDRVPQKATLPLSAADSDKLSFETVALESPIACWAYWSGLAVGR